jgi:hypothetical protein
VNQLRVPPWLRVRDAAELERERKHLEALRWMERLAIMCGMKVRPKQ